MTTPVMIWEGHVATYHLWNAMRHDWHSEVVDLDVIVTITKVEEYEH